jgi:hypothetical protein
VNSALTKSLPLRRMKWLPFEYKPETKRDCMYGVNYAWQRES